MNEEMMSRFEELCKDEEYVKYVLSLDSAEAMSKELENKKIDLSPENIRSIGKLLRKKADGELNDEELQEVAGGLGILAMIGIIAGVSAVCASPLIIFGAAKKKCR